MTGQIPKRPRLRPGLEVYDRRPGEIQIGLDPRHAMVASGLPPGLTKALHRLDGSLRTDELLAIAESEHAGQLEDILADLTKLGLVEEAWAPASRGRAV